MIDPLTQLKPQDVRSAEQVQEIRAITACGVMKAMKLATILNETGKLTWADVHRRHSGILDEKRTK